MAQPRTENTNCNVDDNVIIAVIGGRRSGKSSFIKLLSGKESIEAGDSRESKTLDIQPIDFLDEFSGRRVTLLDTPGFDDSGNGITDTEVLKKITEFLLTEYDTVRNLNGLVYVQSISSAGISSLSTSNLKCFQNLSDSDTFRNVVVLTTFWDDRSAWNVGEDREAELKSGVFLQLAEGGAVFMRHDKTVLSARRVLKHLVHKSELDLLIAKHEAEVAKLQAELKKLKKSNSELKEQLDRETTELQRKLVCAENERAELSKALVSEKKTRQDLEARMQQERDEHKKQEQEWTQKYKEQYEAYKAQLNDLREKLRQVLDDSWIKYEWGMAQELLLVPSLVTKSFLGSLGFGMDIQRAENKSWSKQVEYF
ncbi:hypothetical protein GYMLUDRAFT_245358 [Collybiopsis luxurians FD-317 M1]|uniref:G domain-containing protein n=1 Tax=Collybiopsis luxurians FD-317 M1 TaxID=944289 RepID=A0A0D0CTZ4_9AGAR|nr:hypothetical protein GYMLUDRAFT_245358 [Collybiopsis luxurians FD-317 M1]